MSIRRAPRPKRGFALIDNDVLRDSRVSLRARGLLAMILSYPDDWRFDHVSLARACTEGQTAIRTALRELREAGYIVHEKRRDEKGRWSTEVTVYDRPQHGAPAPAAVPGVGDPSVENQHSDSPHLYVDPYEDHHEQDLNRSAWTTASPTSSATPSEGRGKSHKAQRADRVLRDMADEYGGMDRVLQCLLDCHGAKNPAMWLLELDARGQLDGFLGSQGLGETCWKCNDDDPEENAS